jgi:N6-adenosine-specific RNA methylase IME4
MKFQIIYADPPWLYFNDQSSEMGRGGSNYPKLDLEELKKLPIADITDDDCALFLWATTPKIKEALECLEAWGFKYTTMPFVWVKTNKKCNKSLEELEEDITNGNQGFPKGLYSGMGYWTNSNIEYVLLGKKGKPHRIRKDIKQVVVAPLGRHSAKPPEVRNRIVDLMGDIPRVELFSRDIVSGWQFLGNELDGLDIRESLPLLAKK